MILFLHLHNRNGSIKYRRRKFLKNKKMKVTRMNDKVGYKILTAVMPWGGIVAPNVALVSDAIVNGRKLESVIIEKIAVTIGLDEELSNDVPNRSEKDSNFFEKRSTNSIIKIGETVSFGDVFVSKCKQTALARTPEQKLLQGIFGAQAVVENTSVLMPLRDSGTVVDVVIDGKQIFIYVMIKRPLCVGDVLNNDKGQEFIIARIIPHKQMPRISTQSDERVSIVVTPPTIFKEKLEQVNIVSHKERPTELLLTAQKYKAGKTQWHGTGEQALLGIVPFWKKELLIEEKSWATSTANRYLLSKQLMQGVVINNNFINNLYASQLPHFLQETLTLRSDDVENFPKAHAAIAYSEAFPKPSTPISVKQYILLLQSFGLSVKVDAGKLVISKMTDVEMLALSNGEVKIPETINYKTSKPEPDGLFCQRIFGTVNHYACGCGKYKGITYKDFVCERCGVKVEDNAVRDTKMGHLRLVVPVVHPLFTLENAVFMSFLDHNDNKFVNDDELASYEKQFALLTSNKGKEFSGEIFTGGAGNADALMNTLLILPVGLRPLFLGGEKYTWLTDDLNDLYRRVVIRNNRLKRLIEIKAPSVILCNEIRMLQESVNALFANIDVLTEEERRLRSLDKKFNEIASNLFTKRIGYAGKSIVVPVVDILVSQACIPISIALKIFEPYICRELLSRTEQSSEYCTYHEQNETEVKKIAHHNRQARDLINKNDPRAISIVKEIASRFSVVITSSDQKNVFAFKATVWDEEVIGLHPKAIEALHISNSKRDKAYIHMPLSDITQKEVEKILFSEENEVRLPVEVPPSLLSVQYKNLQKISEGSISISLSDIDKYIFI